MFYFFVSNNGNNNNFNNHVNIVRKSIKTKPDDYWDIETKENYKYTLDVLFFCL